MLLTRCMNMTILHILHADGLDRDVLKKSRKEKHEQYCCCTSKFSNFDKIVLHICLLILKTKYWRDSMIQHWRKSMLEWQKMKHLRTRKIGTMITKIEQATFTFRCPTLLVHAAGKDSIRLLAYVKKSTTYYCSHKSLTMFTSINVTVWQIGTRTIALRVKAEKRSKHGKTMMKYLSRKQEKVNSLYFTRMHCRKYSWKN